MSTTSQVPTLLTAVFNAAFAALSSVTVIDGPPLSWDPLVVPGGGVGDVQWLFIGARPEDDNAVHSAQQTRNTLGPSRTEDIVAAATAIAKGDETQMALARSQAFTIVAALEQALRTDETLGGAVSTATVSVDKYEQAQQEDGAYAVVTLSVAARAFLR